MAMVELHRADALQCPPSGAKRRLAILNQELSTDTLVGIFEIGTTLVSATAKIQLTIWMFCEKSR
jgi:hypothetical protein